MRRAPWQRYVRLTDAFSDRLGHAVSWMTLLMVAIGAFNALARYLGRFIGFNLSSNAYLEAQWYLFSLVFLLGAAYALRQDAHVRVDVFYSRVSDRVRAWIDLLGAVLFLVPFSIFGIWVSWPAVRNSWKIHEMSSDPGGLPRYPIKTVILLGFALLILQGSAEAVRNALRILELRDARRAGVAEESES